MVATLPPVLPAGAAVDLIGTVGNRDIEISRDYAQAVFHRCRQPMQPLDFDIDWDDQPSRHKTYLGVNRLPLPTGLPRLGPAAGPLLGQHPTAGAGWDLGTMAAALRLSYGVLDRRLRVNWNQDAEKRAYYSATTWGRGTASGGGMYPLELYWVAGPSGPLHPGVYHYASAHHALERLLTADVTGQVLGALADPADAAGTDQFLLVSVRFWKNSFKYNSFCYHVVTQDCGALLGSWELLGAAVGDRPRRLMWFDERAMDALLGLDTATESVLAVLPLRWAAPDQQPARQPAQITGGAAGVRREFFERSRRLLRFPTVDQVHAAALVGPAPRPAPATGAAPGPRQGRTVALPPPLTQRLGADLADVVRARRSSFGGFTSAPKLRLDELGTLLAGAAAAGLGRSDIKPDDTTLTGLYVLANRVDGLAGGGYAYDRDRHELRQVLDPPQPLGELLQRYYLLSNYNIEQVAAVLAITARLEPMLASHGNRGYRVLNHEVGAVAQAGYLTAAALGVGCGAVLGLDNVAVDDLLGIGPAHGDDERTFLFLLVGPERTDPADVELRLV